VLGVDEIPNSSFEKLVNDLKTKVADEVIKEKLHWDPKGYERTMRRRERRRRLREECVDANSLYDVWMTRSG
jgi:hypothetical protein